MRRNGLLTSVIGLAISMQAWGQEAVRCSHPQELRFPAGARDATLSGLVTHDDVQAGCYAFIARKGQVLDISTSPDSSENLAIVVFEPGYAVKKDGDVAYLDGTQLPGATRDDTARKVHRVLPASGRYLIMAGPAIGQAAGYTMRVGIR